MLDVNNERYIPTPYQTDRKDEEFDFDECSQLKSRSKKNRKKVNQNKMCVSSKRRGRYRSGYTLPSPQQKQCGQSSAGRTGSVPTETFNFTGKTYKILQMSYLRRETRNAGDFQSSD
jgi:hypothetical protein